MYKSDESFPPELLDLHLGRLSAAERADLHARIAGDAGLAEQHEALTTVFQALGELQVEPARAGLAERVRARVAQAARPLRIVQRPTPPAELPDLAEPRILRLGNLRDIVAVAAAIVLMVGVGVPGLLNMRERNQRMFCSQNLASLGRGMQQYASTFNAGLPFAGWTPQNSWRSGGDPAAVPMPNRRHVYPLLQARFVPDPRLFLCPACGGVPMPREQVAGRSDFAEARNMSYAYFNMAGARPSLADDPALPIMSDDNPMFEDGVPLLGPLGWGDRTDRNSRAHGGAGQNILTLDGHVKWVTTPNAGIDGDNIWTLQGVKDYTGHEGPKSPTDAHLIR